MPNVLYLKNNLLFSLTGFKIPELKKELQKPNRVITSKPVDIIEDHQIPSININLEIHISADSTPDQIDKIFESMAKHIYKK